MDGSFARILLGAREGLIKDTGWCKGTIVAEGKGRLRGAVSLSTERAENSSIAELGVRLTE